MELRSKLMKKDGRNQRDFASLRSANSARKNSIIRLILICFFFIRRKEKRRGKVRAARFRTLNISSNCRNLLQNSSARRPAKAQLIALICVFVQTVASARWQFL